jgi:hypothetical protein
VHQHQPAHTQSLLRLYLMLCDFRRRSQQRLALARSPCTATHVFAMFLANTGSFRIAA